MVPVWFWFGFGGFRFGLPWVGSGLVQVWFGWVQVWFWFGLGDFKLGSSLVCWDKIWFRFALAGFRFGSGLVSVGSGLLWV